MSSRLPDRFRTFLVAGIALGLSAACAPSYVPGLALRHDSQTVRLSRVSGEGSDLVEGVPARFVLERVLSVDQPRDMTVFARGAGGMDIRLYARAKDKVPVAQGSCTLLAGMNAELRLTVPARAEIAAVELFSSGEAIARVFAFEFRNPFSGVRLGADSYIVDANTSFSGAPWPNAVTLMLPQSSDASLRISLADEGTAKVSIVGSNGETRDLLRAFMRAGSELAVPVTVFGGAATVSVESDAGVAAAILESGRGAPLSDLHAVLAVETPIAGDYALYRWDLLPGTLVFDFVDYDVQDRYLKRLAFFAEKPGFRGRLAADHEIEALHGWNAHDYSTGTLAAFYSEAVDSGFRLNDQEMSLLELLLDFGVLSRDSAGRIGEGSGALISISRESTSGLRRIFLDHEASHALFFQDPEYRKLSARLWGSLSPEARRFWIRHLAWRRYDTRDEYLCVNELQAYLVQQSTAATAAYYEALVKRLVEAYPEDEAAILADAPFAVEEAVAGARALDEYLKSRWDISAGRFGRIRRP